MRPFPASAREAVARETPALQATSDNLGFFINILSFLSFPISSVKTILPDSTAGNHRAARETGLKGGVFGKKR
jgi:hypothetical protein